MFDVITLGSAVVDVFLDTGIPERRHFIAYPVGTKIKVRDLKFATGGGGTNTAVSLSRLGLKTGYLGKIGRDSNGDLIFHELKTEKVTFLGKRDKGNTGFSVVLDSKEHNRTILTYKGANDKLKYSEVNLTKLKTKWFYFASLTGESFKTQEKIANYAIKKGMKIAYNPSSYQTNQGAKYLRNILDKTEVLILNKEEARMLVKFGNLLKGLRKLGPNIVCVTNGRKNIVVYDGNHCYTAKPHDFIGKERTGAGDAFASSFLAGIIKGQPLDFCIQLASANSESVIQYFGAKNKLLHWNEALKKIRKNPVEIKKEVW